MTFAKTRFGYIEVLFHTLYCNWGRKWFRYIEVPLYEREREIGLTPLHRFRLLPQFTHSHPFESRIIPTPPPPRQFYLEEVQSYPALVDSTCTWQFNSYPTIISGDRTKWFSINSLLFWKIGYWGVHLPIIKSPVHHSINSPLFCCKIVRIEESALRAAILDR